jgi:N utilization substance protein A
MDIDLEERIATVHVPADQLSLAIGKSGQNVRLAARLTSMKVNIFEEGSTAPVSDEIGSDGDQEE